MKDPLVYVIVPTRNSAKTLSACLASIVQQMYRQIEIIVVDNNSSDNTAAIANKFTKNVFIKGPERSAQRNFGSTKAKGEYLLFIDSDMELSKEVVADCVKQFIVSDSRTTKINVGAVIIPEKSFGTSFWAKAKALERSFYVGNDAIEAARFFKTAVYNEVGGFDEAITGPEDWDLSQRVKEKYQIERIHSFILHNEGNLSLTTTVGKKYYYAKKFDRYLNKQNNKSSSSYQFGIFQRYGLFFSRPHILFRNPILGCGMLFMKTAEMTAGAIGFIQGRFMKS